MTQRQDYNIIIKKDGKFYVGYCLEIPQARGQGNTKAEAIQDTKQAIKLCKSYLENKKKSSASRLIIPSDEVIKNIKEGIADIKAGRVYTSDQVKRKLGLK